MPYPSTPYLLTTHPSLREAGRRTIREVVDADEEALIVDDRDVVDGAEAEDDDEQFLYQLSRLFNALTLYAG